MSNRMKISHNQPLYLFYVTTCLGNGLSPAFHRLQATPTNPWVRALLQAHAKDL